MNDPHVKALHYRLTHSKDIDYDKAPPLAHETASFNMRIENGKIAFEMKEHHATEESARALVEDFIRAWEVHVGLQYGPDEFRLEYERPEIIDLNPDPGSVSLCASSVEAITFIDNVTLHIGRGRYPNPPTRFSASPDVEVMFTRYMNYRGGRESLSSMAYFCLTVAGKAEQDAKRHAIDYKILKELSRLTSIKGGAAEGRKAPYGDPYSPQERAWIESVVKLLIRRVGERAADPTGALPLIKMADVGQQ